MQRRQQQNLITGIVAAIGLVLVGAVGWFYLQQFRTLSYENSRYGFALKYPAAWSFAEDLAGAAAVFVSPKENALDIFQENVNVVVQDISQHPMSLNKYTEMAVTQMQAVFGTNLEVLDSSPTFIDGREGHQFVFIGKGPDGNFRYLCRWTIVGTSAYQITYTAMESGYPKLLPQAKRMMRSFKIQ